MIKKIKQQQTTTEIKYNINNTTNISFEPKANYSIHISPVTNKTVYRK